MISKIEIKNYDTKIWNDLEQLLISFGVDNVEEVHNVVTTIITSIMQLQEDVKKTNVLINIENKSNKMMNKLFVWMFIINMLILIGIIVWIIR